MDKYTLKREDAILLIIDIQENLLPAVDQARELIEGVNILIETAKTMDIPILVTEQYPKGLGRTVAELKGLEDASLFEKTSFSAFKDSLEQELLSLERRKVILVGMESHICVFQTARDLIDVGYQVFLPVDGVSSRTRDNREGGIALVREMGGLITNIETVVYDLMKDSKVEEFKEILALIK